MSKKQITLLWGCQICLYIANIILNFITGGTPMSCILGWLLSSILAGYIIYLQFRLIDKQKENERLKKEYNQLKPIEMALKRYGVDKSLSTLVKIRENERKKVCDEIKKLALEKERCYLIAKHDLNLIENNSQNQAKTDENKQGQ